MYKDGNTSVRNEQVKDFSTSIARLQKGDADEQVNFDVVKIDDELAIVWAPYKFSGKAISGIAVLIHFNLFALMVFGKFNT